MERNLNGYPVPNSTGDGCAENGEATLSGKPIGYSYVPIQNWKMLYSVEDALGHGTLFEELYLPLEVYGK